MNRALSVVRPIVGNDAEIEGVARVRLAAVLSEEERKRRIAYAIDNTMTRRGMGPPQLAAKVGRSRGTVNDWVANRSTPSLVDLGPLCAALQVKPELFAELPPIPDDPHADYLLDAAEAGVEEGKRRGRSRRRRVPGKPAPSPVRPLHGDGAGSE
jgi:transcriptional regulator with XRE-family HTH domain